GDWRLGDRYFERITAATAPEVTAVVRRYLTPERAGWVMYRPTAAEPVADSPDAALALLTSVPASRLPAGPEGIETPGPAAPPRRRATTDVSRRRARHRANRGAGERRAAARRHVPASGSARDAGRVRSTSVRPRRDRVRGNVRRDRRGSRSRVASGACAPRAH